MVTTSPVTRLQSALGSRVLEPWIVSRGWDLTWIIGSALLIFAPLALHYVGGLPAGVIDVLVAAIIGGPHMYATYTLSYLDPTFRSRFPVYATSALVIPALVFYLALTNIALLITAFMLWASIHVMHQVAFLADCYRRRAGEGWVTASRAIDYAVLFTSLYPFAFQRLVRGEFTIGEKSLLVPDWARGDWLPATAAAAFILASALWLGKTAIEFRAGRLNLPKTALVGVAATSGFLIPLVGNLDVAFEGMNVWHSFQYLGFIWYLNRLRYERGEAQAGLIRNRTGAPTGWRLYALTGGMTLIAGALILGLQAAGLGREQAYFGVILSSLLVHYYVDHFLFFRADEAVGAVPLWGSRSS